MNNLSNASATRDSRAAADLVARRKPYTSIVLVAAAVVLGVSVLVACDSGASNAAAPATTAAALTSTTPTTAPTSTSAAPSTVSASTTSTSVAGQPHYDLEAKATEALAGADVLSMAPDGVVAMLTARREAVNRGDKQATLQFYSTHRLTLYEAEFSPVQVTNGKDNIFTRITEGIDEAGGEVRAAGHPVRFGPYVIEPGYLGSPATPYIWVHILDESGRVEMQLLFTEPTGKGAGSSSTTVASASNPAPAAPAADAETSAAAEAEVLRLAGDEAVSILTARERAVNRGDGMGAAAFYSENGVLEELDTDPPTITTGRAALAAHLQELIDGPGLTIDRAGHPLQFGRYVFEPVFLNGDVSYILVYRLNERGAIEHQWVF